MRWLASVLVVAVAVGLAAAGCGTQGADSGAGAAVSKSPTAEVSESSYLMVESGEDRDVPNPGTGAGDPRLVAALLTRFRDTRESSELPGAVVTLPADIQSTFIPLRQMSSPLEGPGECDKWTAGMWFAVLRTFNVRGVQMAVTTIGRPDLGPGAVDSGRPESPIFSEAIITGPGTMLGALGDPHLPASCGHLPITGYGSGDIEPLTVPRLGERSWAYRVTGTKDVPVWHWVEVIQTSRYLLEIRIPNQEPRPRTDPAELLPQIAEAAYKKAEATLG